MTDHIKTRVRPDAIVASRSIAGAGARPDQLILVACDPGWDERPASEADKIADVFARALAKLDRVPEETNLRIAVQPAYAAADAEARRSLSIASVGALLLFGDDLFATGIGATHIIKADQVGASLLLTPSVLPSHPRVLTASLGAGDPIRGFMVARTKLAADDVAVILLRGGQTAPKVLASHDTTGRPDLEAILGELAGAGGGQPAAVGALCRP